MKIQKAVTGLAAALALTAFSAGESRADITLSVASYGDTLGGSSVSETFTGGSGGVLYTTSPSNLGLPVTISNGVSGNRSAVMTISNLTVQSPAGPNFDGSMSQLMSGGSFAFTENGTGTLLLSGNFAQTVLTGKSTVPTINLKTNGNTIVYTGGVYLSELGVATGSPGSFSFSFSGSDSGQGTNVPGPSFVTEGPFTYFGAFISNGTSGTFDTTIPTNPVPEPGTVASFTLGGLALLGLAMRRRRAMPLA